jgi:hypothetical protein
MAEVPKTAVIPYWNPDTKTRGRESYFYEAAKREDLWCWQSQSNPKRRYVPIVHSARCAVKTGAVFAGMLKAEKPILSSASALPSDNISNGRGAVLLRSLDVPHRSHCPG